MIREIDLFSRGDIMKVWNKKMMTLACATCLTVGMGAVVYADTVDLGYGQTANTSAAVKAVAMVKVPTQMNERTVEQNKIAKYANKDAVDTLNSVSTFLYKVPTKYSGNVYDGFSLYQLQGENHLGYHKAYLMNIDVSKEYIKQRIAYEQAVLQQGTEEVKAQFKHGFSSIGSEYSKSIAEQALKNVKPYTLSSEELHSKVVDINRELPKALSDVTDEALQQGTGLSVTEKQELGTLLKRITAPITINATHISYTPVNTRYGMAGKGVIRSSLGYDGFIYPTSLIGYLVPAKEGLILQILFTEDTSYDFWNTELDRMNQTVEYKGAQK